MVFIDLIQIIPNLKGIIMFPAAEICFCCFFIYLAITRIFPQCIRWIIKRCYHIEARIGRIGIPYMTLHDVHLCTNGYTIEIDQIGFRSSFLSSEVSKLVNVVIHDMRINKDMVGQSKHSTWRPPESFDDVRIPPLVITIAQFVSVRILNVTLAVVSHSLVLHSTLTEVSTDASVVHSTRCLLVSLNLASSTARLLSVSGRVHVSAACVGVDASLIASTPLAVQNVSVSFKNMKTVIDDDFFPNIERKQKKDSDNMTEQRTELKQLINRSSPIIPKELSISFDNCIITDATDRDMTTLQKFLINTSFKPSVRQYCGVYGSIGVNFVLEGLDMMSATDTQLVLKLLEFNMNLGERGLITHLVVREFTTLYDHDKMNWLSQLLPQTEDGEKKQDEKNWWPDIAIEAKFEFWNVSTALRMPNLSPAVIGFSHLKFSYDSNNSSQPNSGELWELLSESVWCQLAKFGGPGNLRKEHTWGTALAAGLILVKGEHTRSSALLDTVRLEWSPPLADILLPLVSMVSSRMKNSRAQPLKSSNKPNSINLSLANTNIFFIANKKVCLMMRVDSAGIESSLPLKLCIEAEGIKISSISPTTPTFLCVRSSEIKGWSGNIELLRGEWNQSLNTLNIKISRQIQLQWNPNLHLKTMEMCLHVMDFFRGLKNEDDNPSPATRSSLKPLNLSISLTGHVKLVLKLSKQHHFTFTTDDFSYNKSGKDCSWSTSSIKLAVDSADIFAIEGLSFAVLRENDSAKENIDLIKTERVNNEGFVLPWNRAWLIKMKSVKAIFPYEHNFSPAFQDEFITVFKWMKRLHKSPSKHSSKLPPDLLIKIKDFIFEMSDDPFEVRLRDNYELLEDEYNENLKRQKMLDEKINEMMETNVMMPAGKVEDLYNTLSIVSTRIYIKRSKLMQEQGTRTRLFAWLVSDLQVLALSDPTIHGPANVVNNMTQIDPESPWPSEGLEFSTLWCRAVVINCKELKFLLRDFPQPWLDLRQLQMWGKVVGAEQIPTRRAKRNVKLDLGEGWGEIEIERSMTTLKLYHDLNCEIEHFSYAFGPCWEPVIAQCNLSFEKIVRGSLDPSPPLPLWDKLRLLLHGRVTLIIRQLTVLLHASLDPYNKTEEMEITWSSVAIDWTNAKVVFKGNLDIYVRTASKYDDCRLLHLPNLRLSIKLGWVCLGDPNDHHSVMPCAPDKLPDYSSNQEHDSFRAFRSQNLNVRLALETKPVASSAGNDFNCPVALLYGSTLRWFENLKLILSGVTRPTRRGSVFHNLRPRKLPLSRHYKKVHLLLSLHTFQVHYWMSFAMQRGFELTGESIGFSSEHLLSLVPINDGLKHRPRAEWSVVYMTCELYAAEIWLRSAIQNNDQPKEKLSLMQPVEKCYFLSVGKVSYGREGAGFDSAANPTHRLVVHGLRGAWTTSNRDVVAALYDTFIKTKQLKKNLSTEALKGFRRETNSGGLKPQSHPAENQTTNLSTPNQRDIQQQATPSPLSKLQCGHAATMLQQLIAEADTKAVVFSDEPTTEANEQQLQGLAACQHNDDVIHKNWLIALVNSQVLLKGPETEGYVIISAAKAEILQRLHRPVWRDRTLVAKTTWVGSLLSMQYYATVSAGQASLDENIMWLNIDNIKEKDDCVIAELPDVPQLVGSGQSVGGVVSETVGASCAGNDPPLQLQRIVSRCKCEFFYVCYGENSMSPSNFSNVPTPPTEDSATLWENQTPPVDAFTLMHHDLDVCTNSLQYAMLLDIINNLLLYVEQSRREAYECVQRMRFQLQLQSVEDQRRPIQEAQTRVRSLLSKLKGLEKEMYLVQRALGDEPNSPHLIQQMESLERQVFACKEALTVQSEELNAMISCYKETQLMGQKSASHARSGDTSISVVRASEICFKHAQWRLTDADGQLGIADLVLSNFLYTKNSKSDDSVEHLLELGYVRMTNLLPNQIYREVLQPTEIHNNMPIDRKRALRVFCREKAPVGGISVKEHFEINLVPLTIGLTKKFFNKMLKFCFPERDTEEGELPDDSGSVDGVRRTKLHHKGKEASFYVPIERKDDVEKMKERAEKNKLFIYIKIPEVPVRVSYKGNKEKNFEDIRDFSLVIPTLEYHNVTWTWLDLLLAMKSDSRRVILSQAIKQKLQIKFRSGPDEGALPQEEDKARMLFGNRHMPGENKSLKRGIFKFQK